jgi:cytochrome P450
MQRLREELDSVLDEDDDIAPYEKVKYLPYLRACLDESLRLFPPTSHGLPRMTPAEGASVLGEYLPAGVTVSMSAYVVHRDSNIFPEPDKFIPERWLGEAGKDLGPYFVSFSAGARGCIGRNISYLEQTVATATMIHRYDIELANPAFEPERRETFNLHLDEVPIKLKRRDLIEST